MSAARREQAAMAMKAWESHDANTFASSLADGFTGIIVQLGMELP